MPDRCGWIPMNLWKHDQNCNWLDIRGLLAIHPCVVHLILPYSFIIISLTFLYLIVLLLNFICKLCSSLSLSLRFFLICKKMICSTLSQSVSQTFLYSIIIAFHPCVVHLILPYSFIITFLYSIVFLWIV